MIWNCVLLPRCRSKHSFILKGSKMSPMIIHAFIVRRNDGSDMQFVPSKDGLYHYDYNISIKRRIALESLKKTLIVNTVEDMKRNFTKGEIEKADNARRLYV
jgi:hypothetical protein